ncbi:hypothetical protein ACFW7J_35195 [Streptomyces sp. NPDC059525]|uniref:hypothetical protein n=1 Tax=Streptomyces sp. NPDC059525 TaxID=3346857 RepID=UPI0036B28B24
MSTPPTPPHDPSGPPIPEGAAPGHPAAPDPAAAPAEGPTGTPPAAPAPEQPPAEPAPETLAEDLAETARLSFDQPATSAPPERTPPTAEVPAADAAETARLSFDKPAAPAQPQDTPDPAADLAETARLPQPVPQDAPVPAADQAETARLSLDKPAAEPAPQAPAEPLAETARLSFDKAATPQDPAAPAAGGETARGSWEKPEAAAPAAPPVQPAPAAGGGAPEGYNPWAAPAPGAFAAPGGGAHAGFAQPAPGAPGPFAPPPPGAPYGAPGGSWGPPPQGGYPGYPAYPGYPGVAGYYPVPRPVTNGLAVAGLVLGLLAVVLGIIPFFFWLGVLLALTGIGISGGAIARARKGAGRRTMAIVGVALGVIGLGTSAGGWLLTTAILDKAHDRRVHERLDDPQWGEDPEDWEDDPTTPTPSVPRFSVPPKAPSQGPGFSTPVPFGQTVTYPDGLKVTLAPPRKYVSKAEWMDVGNAVEVSFTITNNTDKPHNVIYAMPAVKDDKGGSAKLVFDGETPKRIEGVIKPGQSATGVAAFEVPAGTKSISAELSPGILLPAAKFSGPVG